MNGRHGGGSAGIVRDTMAGDGGGGCIDGGSAFMGDGGTQV